MVAGAIGNVGYYSDLTVFDRVGLVDREVASLPIDLAQLHSPGHDRLVDPVFFLDRHPTFLDAQLLVGNALAPEVLDAWVQRWNKSRAASRYAPDFRISLDGEVAPALLLVWRAVAPGQDAGERWEQFFARARAIDWAKLRAAPR